MLSAARIRSDSFSCFSLYLGTISKLITDNESHPFLNQSYEIFINGGAPQKDCTDSNIIVN